MSVRFSTATPVETCPEPPIQRDRWLVNSIQIALEKNRVNIVVTNGLSDGQVIKDRRQVRATIAYDDIENYAVGTATTFGELLADMLENKLKSTGLMPDGASPL